MRIIKNILLVMIAAVITVSCSKKDDVTPEAAATNALNGSWITTGGYVKVDGTDVSNSYSNFKISFSATTGGEHIYTVTNGSYAFANITTDLWTFDGSGFTTIKRSDDLLMTYSITDGFLTLNFAVADPVDNGRVDGMFGNFEMKLSKK